MIVELDFVNRSESKVDDATTRMLEAAIRTAMSHFDISVGYQADVSFVDPDEIRSLNREYRDVDEITDVLSFPMDDFDERGVALLGDVVICLERAREQSVEYGHSLEREMCYLAVHSVLHLMGFDHETDEETKEMRSLEKIVMDELGVYKDPLKLIMPTDVDLE
jgi:probable rRNA maturation factor